MDIEFIAVRILIVATVFNLLYQMYLFGFNEACDIIRKRNAED